jgi:SAM-dependent methyltransferase
MDQDKLWDYLQNEGLRPGTFSEGRPRYLARYLRSGSQVLNIGVGAGRLEELALARGVVMHSLDPDARAIEGLRERLQMSGRAHVGYAQAMPFPDHAFDAVVMAEVIEHLDDATLAGALDETRRTLKPGGMLLVTTPYREVLEDNAVFCPQCGNVFHRYGHAQSFDKPRLRTLLERHQYAVERLLVTGFVDWERRGVRNLLKSLARFALARLGEPIAGPHLVAVARTAAGAGHGVRG